MMRIARLVCGALVAFAGSALAETKPDPLANVWATTKVVFPAEPTNYFYRPGFTLDRAVAEFRPQSEAAIILLPDCAELTVSSREITQTATGLARAGFVVFIPNAVDRPRAPYCGNPSEYRITVADVRERLAEIEHIREQIRQLPWIDQANVSAVGHGLGGHALTQLASSTFPVVAVSGVNCMPAEHSGLKPGIAAPAGVAVLALLGTHDETFRENLYERNCGMFPEMKQTGRKSVLLPGIGHDVTRDPAALPIIIEFMKAYGTRRVKTVAQGPAQ